MKTLTEHEDFYSRLSDAGEKLLDKIEAKTIWMMKHHEHGEEL